jgi:subtilisin-like proprotein convertase family protein
MVRSVCAVLALIVMAPLGSLGARVPFTPNDPLYFGGQDGNENGQTYLHGRKWVGGELLDDQAPHINVLGAWAGGYTGLGVVIGIVDDGLETAHEDLAPNFVAEHSYNFGALVGQDPANVNPVNPGDRHGMPAAGIAAASGGNGVGVTGVAPYAGLSALRIDWYDATSDMFTQATEYHSDQIQVKSHSYTRSISYMHDQEMVLANRNSAAAGCVNVRAAGNGHVNANAKSVQSDRTSVVVAALGSDWQAADYSNFGANVFVTAPSSDSLYNLTQITTTDRSGAEGFNGISGYGSYTNAFGGTSASTPVVAGAVALVLQANPDLDVRGVKHVLAATSRVVDADHSGWRTNGAGYSFNPFYGFGLVDATAAVDYAASYTPPGNEISIGTGQVAVGQAIADIGPAVTNTFTITDTNPLESIELDITLADGPYWGNYDIFLTSPSGTTSQLAYSEIGAPGAFELTTWEFSSAQFWGENPVGQWTISIQDLVEQDSSTWQSYEFTGYSADVEPVTPGDTDGDHDVDIDDYNNLVARLGGLPGDDSADFNNDGIIDLGDFAILRGNFGYGVSASLDAPEATATPEPTTLSLLALGGLAMLRRRR